MKTTEDWGCGFVEDCLPNICEALSLIPNIVKNKNSSGKFKFQTYEYDFIRKHPCSSVYMLYMLLLCENDGVEYWQPRPYGLQSYLLSPFTENLLVP
jgi:hypothetical protein